MKSKKERKCEACMVIDINMDATFYVNGTFKGADEYIPYRTYLCDKHVQEILNGTFWEGLVWKGAIMTLRKDK